MSEVFTEITPLTDKDCFYIAERHKTEFTYPLHRHTAFELNFIEHGKGAQRIVGDSVEYIDDYDLVLIGGENLEHVWKQGTCNSPDIREITIQFSVGLFPGDLLSKTQFTSIKRMLDQAEHGLSFPMSTIMRVYSILNGIAGIREKFYQFTEFLSLLYQLSVTDGAKMLASSSSALAEGAHEEERVLKVKRYIEEHYAENIQLGQLAGMVCMTPASFSRFFKIKTGSTLSDYLIDVRLGNAARLLVDTSMNISDICYECGFNNQSNFNRIFKSKRDITPRDFRAMFKKNKVIV